MMEANEVPQSGLINRVAERLQSDESRQLFAALLEAQRRGGARGLKELMAGALSEARELRPEDTEEIVDDREVGVGGG
jgi:hypothetical protein